MKIRLAELPDGGSTIEFETERELISEESLKKRRSLEERIPRLIQMIQKGMDVYGQRLKDRKR